MKILFLYNDKIHAWPVLNSVEHMSVLGIDVIHYHASLSEVSKYLSGSYDAILIHQELMCNEVVECGLPVIILERVDGAQLGRSRPWLCDVAAVFKGYSLREPQDHNTYRGRVFIHRMADAGIKPVIAKMTKVVPGRPCPQLSETELNKIHVWYGFGAYQKQEHLRTSDVDFRADRETSVHFAGTVNYDMSEVETHRRHALHRASSMPDGVGKAGRFFVKGAYPRSMLASRTVLCPFGWGESAHRDYEAMLLGCVVIKPYMSIISWPEIYVPTVTYLPCRYDFADVPDLVERVTKDWKGFRRWRERAHHLAKSAGNSAKIAARFCELLEKVL